MLVLALLLIGGCLKNPFATRHSESPEGVTGTLETPASPEAVMRNLINAYNEKNDQNYGSCLADNFTFSAPEDSIAHSSGNLYDGWDKQVELGTSQNIFSTFSISGHQLLLTMRESANNPDSIGDTVAVIYRNYEIRIIVADSIGSDTSIAQGLSLFRLNSAQIGYWNIYFWQDLPEPVGSYDWSQFKAEYRH
jgi:hypothetical protein